MKKNTTFKTAILLVLAGLVFWSCNKSDIGDRSLAYKPLEPENQDLNAGTWKPVLLASADEFEVAAPAATNTPGYTAELNEIKGFQGSLSDKDKSSIKYWSAGAVLRWNEILRELVALRNIPPYQKEDDTYPAPSPTNPFAYPTFPFANPPYAGRAYAYVSAATYDALVAAWHYKQLYNRAAPYNVDSSVQALVPKSSLPSYPSEDAVVAGATIELLKLLFPADLAYVQEKADEHMRARIMSGANTRSDIEAGLALGKMVAAKFVARGRTDRAGQAGGNPEIWKALEDNTMAKGEVCWFSLETPRRPPMLPLFNKVKPFLFDSLTVINMRPPPPPSTSSEQFKKETEEVLYYSSHPTRERVKIVHFWADGAGTYTPAGHWDHIAASEFVKENYSEVRWARNMALLNMALCDAGIVCWDAKYFYFNPRPSQSNPDIKTLTGLPNFPAYTSGHSTFSAAAATVLTHLLPDRGTKFDDMATEAALSRLYGAIHYRSDSEAGLVSGKAVGEYAVQRALTDGAN
ncbi:MAG: phosphatase PAP2 family protein [Chitinophagaceae bacterium]|nr:phosphatase PAP2 family protein [Chitinophagaceae bacterium]